MFAGLDNVEIGYTLVTNENAGANAALPLEPIAVEQPTVRMTIGVNKSPLAGREGKFLTSRMIRDRLFKELDRNVALRVEETDSADQYMVSGRGQLHLTVLIENMRRGECRKFFYLLTCVNYGMIHFSRACLSNTI